MSVNLTVVDKIYAHFAATDREIIYYGCMNLLSLEKADDSMMGLVNKEIVQEFY